MMLYVPHITFLQHCGVTLRIGILYGQGKGGLSSSHLAVFAELGMILLAKPFAQP